MRKILIVSIAMLLLFSSMSMVAIARDKSKEGRVQNNAAHEAALRALYENKDRFRSNGQRRINSLARS